MFRKQNEIRADMVAAQAAYEAIANTAAAPEVRAASQRVKALRKELSDALTVGAEPCETCGAMPLGLRHIHARKGGENAEGVPFVLFSHEYEVGCVGCGDKRAIVSTPEEAEGAALDEYADETIARAVKRWNDEKYRPSRQKRAKA